MKGYLWTGGPSAERRGSAGAGGPSGLARWEAIAVDAVGNVIEFWGFKRNQGRVWALLFLRGEPKSAPDIEAELSLSKGGVSMLLRDLERWGVVQRVREPGSAAWLYRAETDLVRMATRVIEERELTFIANVRADLQLARELAEDAHAPRETLGRLGKMSMLAEQAERALRVFVKTSRLDFSGFFGVFHKE